MIRPIFVVIISLLLICQSFTKLWIIASFKINQEKISQTLCKQKDKKNNTCKGRCHLLKQIKNAEHHSDSQFPSPLKDLLKDINYYFEDSDNHTIKIYPFWSKNVFNVTNKIYTTTYLTKIFKPPEVTLV